MKKYKALQLINKKKFKEIELDFPYLNKGEVLLKVKKCSICRTDVKIFKNGHKDLKLPRILGHEIFGEYNKKKYVVWPGNSCGKCFFCKNNLENLCDEIKILGFNHDGGFAEYIKVNQKNLIEVTEKISDSIANFCEPTACAVNAIEKISFKINKKYLIFGAGILGILLYLVLKSKGAKNIFLYDINKLKAENLQKKFKFNLIENIKVDFFDCIINANSSLNSFKNCLNSVKKNGEIIFFSGISNSEKIEFKLINQLHYKEIKLFGAYGCTRLNMKNSLKILEKYNELLKNLIEEKVKLKDVEKLLNKINSEKYLKFIIDLEK